MQKYVTEYGDALVPIRHITPDGFKLGSWVGHRREYYKTGKLTLEQIKQLEKIPGWIWNPTETEFNNKLQRLQKYIAEHGNALVPQKYITPDGYKLGSWISTCRRSYKKRNLSVDNIKRLEALAGWTWDPLETAFTEGFTHLQDYITEHGHARVPFSYKTSDRYKLGNWVHSRRKDYNQGKLTQGKIHQLETVPGWVWDAR